jgi:hypothetical protein
MAKSQTFFKKGNLRNKRRGVEWNYEKHKNEEYFDQRLGWLIACFLKLRRFCEDPEKQLERK